MGGETQKRNGEGLGWGAERRRNEMMKGGDGWLGELVLLVNVKVWGCRRWVDGEKSRGENIENVVVVVDDVFCLPDLGQATS